MTATETTRKAERWRAQWAELFSEVVTSGLCTGCAGCVVACPHDVLGYDDTDGVYRPYHLEDELGPGDCGHGQRGCTSCTRACPRFRNWETEIDTYLFGRAASPTRCRASPGRLAGPGHRPGAARATARTAASSPPSCLVLEHDLIDAALVSFLEGDGAHLEGHARLGPDPGRDPGVGGVPLYLLGEHPRLRRGRGRGAERLALVGMSCQSSAPAVMRARKAGKVAGAWASPSG